MKTLFNLTVKTCTSGLLEHFLPMFYLLLPSENEHSLSIIFEADLTEPRN